MTDIHEQAEARRAAIAECGACDSEGWILGTDGRPTDPARRCTHNQPHDWSDR